MEKENAWERLCCKHSGTGEVSPIRPGAHLVGGIQGLLNEDLVSGLLWTLLNTEEFYYQNSSVIVVHNYADISRLKVSLNDGRNLINWHDRLVDHRFIGEGRFGEVFQATDKLTGVKYALKGVMPIQEECNEDECISSLFESLSFLLLERNMYAELNRSPFFVRMIAAFENEDMSRFWFVLDFCICDLQKVLSLYSSYNDPDQLVEDYLNSESLEKISAEMSGMLGTDYIELVFLYLFELLSALHYLATHHIIHADVKLENILISRNGHIKLADFGVSYRNNWFDRNSIVLLPRNEAEMKEAEEKDKKFVKQGTVDYYDPEMMIDELIIEDMGGYEMLKDILENSSNFKSITNMHQNFMSDLYAAGMAVFELISGGIMFINNSISGDDDITFWGIQIVYNDDKRKEFLEDKLYGFSKCSQIMSILNFLLSIYAPRLIRAEEFRSEISVFHQKFRSIEYYIDIHKVENIAYYKSKLITKENILNFIFPEDYIQKLYEEFKPRGKKVDIFDNRNNRNKKRIFNLHPFKYTLGSNN